MKIRSTDLRGGGGGADITYNELEEEQNKGWTAETKISYSDRDLYRFLKPVCNWPTLTPESIMTNLLFVAVVPQNSRQIWLTFPFFFWVQSQFYNEQDRFSLQIHLQRSGRLEVHLPKVRQPCYLLPQRETVKQTNIVVVKKQTNVISIFAWLMIFMIEWIETPFYGVVLIIYKSSFFNICPRFSS